MKVLYHKKETVDCTADPHEVNYETLSEALDDILKAASSDLVWVIESVAIYPNDDYKSAEYDPDKHDALYKSDEYSTTYYSFQKREDSKEKAEQRIKHQKTSRAKERKIDKGFFETDAKVYSPHHLLPGLDGVKQAIEIIKNMKNPAEIIETFYIGLSWEFIKDSSCSDNIILTFDPIVVDYSNQDSWMDHENYPEHCHKLSKLLGVEIVPNL